MIARCRMLRIIVIAFLVGLGAPHAARAQESDSAQWNSARALELVTRAAERRTLPRGDSALYNYRADARGWVYFYLDRRETDERTLVKTDQIALELYWATPNATQQRIVGLRDESRLPNRMYYHLDHLTVVQNGFGDTIRVGDGDEVRDVLHPAAATATSTYDYQLIDSLTLVLPGAPEPVRVYEVRVRPRRSDRPGYVGSIFIDRASADVVRLTFTFTPSSYVDRRLDYINISLDNGLWNGRYWLPYEQTVEIRRQLPELDFVAGAVISGRMRVTGYEFNTDLPSHAFRGPPVTAVSEAAREAFPFEQDLYDDLRESGLAPPAELAELRRTAAALLRRRALSGLPRLRLNVPGVSSVVRFNRLEGMTLGAGMSFVPSPALRIDGTIARAFDIERTGARMQLHYTLNPTWSVHGAAYRNDLRDAGFRAGMPGLINSFTAAIAGDDYTDPYHASGASIGVTRSIGPTTTLALDVSTERHRGGPESEPFSGDDFTRPYLQIRAGNYRIAQLSVERSPSENSPLALRADIEYGDTERSNYGRMLLEATTAITNVHATRALELGATVGAISNGAPVQRRFLAGGRHTLPGYPYRGFLGDALVLASSEYSHALWHPWLRGRALFVAGNVSELHESNTSRTGSGFVTSAGIGAALFFDQLRLDLVRGLNGGGETQLLLTFARDFWSVL